MDKKALLETQVSSELLFDGKIVRLYRDEVRLPDGSLSFREVVRHHGGVGVLPLLTVRLSLKSLPVSWKRGRIHWNAASGSFLKKSVLKRRSGFSWATSIRRSGMTTKSSGSI